MKIFRAGTAFAICAVAVVSAGAARAASPYEELLASEAARLAAHAAQPEAAGALAAIASLDEDVDPAALEAAVRGGLVKGAQPLVAAQASWLLAHLLEQRGETREAASLRASLGLCDKKLLLVIGRMVPQKRHADLLAAWPKLRALDQRLHLIVVSAAPRRRAPDPAAARF